MDNSKRIEKHRAKMQKYTVGITGEYPSRNLNEQIKTSLVAVEDLIDRGLYDEAEAEVARRDEMFRKEMINLLLKVGKYEEADRLLPKNTNNPDLLHLAMFVKYRLGTDFEALAKIIKANLIRYSELEAEMPVEAAHCRATDLQCWGIFLSIQGKYSEALEKYYESYSALPLAETLFNIFCYYNRISDETKAREAFQHLQVFLSPHPVKPDHLDEKLWSFALQKIQAGPLLEKINCDVACDRYRKEPWFEAILTKIKESMASSAGDRKRE